MGEFLQHLIRFTEPLVSGGLALIMACWIFYARDPEGFREHIAALRSDSLRWAYAVAAFVVATSAGAVLEQASTYIADCPWHPRSASIKRTKPALRPAGLARNEKRAVTEQTCLPASRNE